MNKKEIEYILKNYFWMVKEIARLRETVGSFKGGATAQYGIESTLPKAQNKTSDPVYLEVARREKQSGRIEKLEQKVLFIQQNYYLIVDDREQTVLECLLDGLNVVAIAHHMGISERHVHRIKDDIVNKLFKGTQSMQKMS